MFVIRGRYSEPLGDMTGVEQTALAEFLGERLPEILASITGQPRALRVLIPVVHAAGPRGVPPSIHCGRRSMPLCVAPDRTG
jgi:hypothetical protein